MKVVFEPSAIYPQTDTVIFVNDMLVGVVTNRYDNWRGYTKETLPDCRRWVRATTKEDAIAKTIRSAGFTNDQ